MGDVVLRWADVLQMAHAMVSHVRLLQEHLDEDVSLVLEVLVAVFFPGIALSP